MTMTAPSTSVVQLDMNSERSWWATGNEAITAALADHYGADVAAEALPPPRDPAGLRARLREVAPQLTALTDRIRRAFDDDRACAVLIPELGLGGLGIDEKRKGVFALAVLLGDPTANIPFDRVLWDVRNRGEESTGHTSFSENDREAHYHTDNGSLPLPEHFFFLYSVQAARCGGGVSLLRDGRVLKKQLEETPEGRAAVALLTETKLPRRIPKAFHAYSDVSPDGFLYAPVLADTPMWRWRQGGIRRGIAAHPECGTPEIRKALDTLIELLEHGPDEIRLVIPTDGILIINNHIALHGRTAFTDPERHLLRLRFHEAPAAQTG
jgi:alpha-ketoglutarate-dependent taurine dioxygenase